VQQYFDPLDAARPFSVVSEAEWRRAAACYRYASANDKDVAAGERGAADFLLGEVRVAAGDAGEENMWANAKQAFFNAMNKSYKHPTDESGVMRRVMVTYEHLGGDVAMTIDVAMLRVQQAVAAPRDKKQALIDLAFEKYDRVLRLGGTAAHAVRFLDGWKTSEKVADPAHVNAYFSAFKMAEAVHPDAYELHRLMGAYWYGIYK
jgi:hypothetical protein